MARAKTPAAKTPTTAAAATLFDAYWNAPDDSALLRVYADELDRAGDPRGAFIQVCLAENHNLRRAILKKYGGALVGPGREFLREYTFGANGLVETARTEADKVIAGIGAIGQINPRLILTITSVKTVALAKDLAKISLERIYFVDFTAITGTHGGTQLPDKVLRVIGPAFTNVRRLALSCRGRPEQCFSPDGLRAFSEHLGRLEYLNFDYYSAGLPPVAEYASVLAKIPSLRVVHCFEMKPADLAGSHVKLSTSEKTPQDFAAIEAELA